MEPPPWRTPLGLFAAPLPSALLLGFRPVHAGVRHWVRQSPRELDDAGSEGLRSHPDAAFNLGWTSFSYNPRFLWKRGGRRLGGSGICGAVGPPKRFIGFTAHPEAMQQDRQLTRHRPDSLLLAHSIPRPRDPQP
jgi:hypothetical protein